MNRSIYGLVVPFVIGCTFLGSAGFAQNLQPESNPIALGDGQMTYYTDQQVKQYEAAKVARFRKEALQLKATDGGTLTPEHRAYLQEKWSKMRG